MVYKTSGVCSSAISFEIDDAGKVHDVKFQGGCPGNTQGVARLQKAWMPKKLSAEWKGFVVASNQHPARISLQKL